MQGISLERLFLKKFSNRNELQIAPKGQNILAQDSVLSNDAFKNIER
jgi:hypothetical protein